MPIHFKKLIINYQTWILLAHSTETPISSHETLKKKIKTKYVKMSCKVMHVSSPHNTDEITNFSNFISYLYLIASFSSDIWIMLFFQIVKLFSPKYFCSYFLKLKSSFLPDFQMAFSIVSLVFPWFLYF